MAKRDKTGFSPPALGGSSLLVVFAVLSLTVFALLSLSTVRADQRLGEATAKAVGDYYAADAQAQELLARLRAGQVPEGVQETAQGYAYACAISETQALQVELRAGSGGLEVLCWQVVPTTQWEGWDGMVVWSGDDNDGDDGGEG